MPSRRERERRIVQARHSNHMEGLDVTPATLADAGDYIDGRIDSHELRRRVRARYGITGWTSAQQR